MSELAPPPTRLRAGLVPIAVGLVLASGLIMTEAVAAQAAGLLLCAAAALFVWRTDLSPLWALGAGGVLGLVLLP